MYSHNNSLQVICPKQQYQKNTFVKKVDYLIALIAEAKQQMKRRPPSVPRMAIPTIEMPPAADTPSVVDTMDIVVSIVSVSMPTSSSLRQKRWIIIQPSGYSMRSVSKSSRQRGVERCLWVEGIFSLGPISGGWSQEEYKNPRGGALGMQLVGSGGALFALLRQKIADKYCMTTPWGVVALYEPNPGCEIPKYLTSGHIIWSKAHPELCCPLWSGCEWVSYVAPDVLSGAQSHWSAQSAARVTRIPFLHLVMQQTMYMRQSTLGHREGPLLHKWVIWCNGWLTDGELTCACIGSQANESKRCRVFRDAVLDSVNVIQHFAFAIKAIR